MPFEAWPSLCPKSTENGAEACRTERTARDGLTCWMPFLHAWKPWTCQRFAHFHLARRSKGRLQMFVRKFMANAPVPKRWASTFELDLKSMTLRFHGAPKASHSSGTTLTANCQQPSCNGWTAGPAGAIEFRGAGSNKSCSSVSAKFAITFSRFLARPGNMKRQSSVMLF